MVTKNNFGLRDKHRTPNFFRDNIGENVNLYGTSPATTYSGKLIHYDHDRQLITLNPYVNIVYDSEGKMQYQEICRNFEIPVEIIGARERTTQEDRIGRLLKYNKDLDKSKQ